jgi:hypothetical protein
MNREPPRRVLDYRDPPPADPGSRFRLADAGLLVTFVFYAAANVALLAHAFGPGPSSPWGVLFAFAVPLPAMFALVAALAQYLASPPPFSRLVLLAVILLLVVEAFINFFVGFAASASV